MTVILIVLAMALHMSRTTCPVQRMVHPVHARRCSPRNLRVVSCSAADGSKRVIKGKCFVTKDVRAACASRFDHPNTHAQNIDTDQIIPAEYLTLVPSKVCCLMHLYRRHQRSHQQPDEYEKLGSYALIGLPDDLYPERCV